jgi:hypothetical protein
VVPGRAHDRLDGADDDIWLPLGRLDEVVAAQRDDVDMIAGERGELVLHRRPQSVQGARQVRGNHPSPLLLMAAGRDDHQWRITEGPHAIGERLAGGEVDPLLHATEHFAADVGRHLLGPYRKLSPVSRHRPRSGCRPGSLPPER